MKRIGFFLTAILVASAINAQKVELGVIGNLSKMQSRIYNGILPQFYYPSSTDLHAGGRFAYNFAKHGSLEATAGVAKYMTYDYYWWGYCCFGPCRPYYGTNAKTTVLRFETNYRFTALKKSPVQPYVSVGFTHDIEVPTKKTYVNFQKVQERRIDMLYAPMEEPKTQYFVAANLKPGVRATIANRYSIDIETFMRLYLFGTDYHAERTNFGLQLGLNYSI